MPSEHVIPDGPAEAPMWPPGWHVTVVESTGSTNDDLVAAGAAGAPDRSVLVARHQSAGRGRLDRRWDAPPGSNLLVSILFRTVPAVAAELTQRVGLAACAVARGAGVDATLKWPNDVLVGERKLAGILAQGGPDLAFVVIGLGLNVRWCPPGAVCLGPHHDPLAVLADVLRALDAQPDDIRPQYRAALATLGRHVRAELTDRVIEGTATDVDADGRLVLLDGAGRRHLLSVADVVHVRGAPG